MSFSKILLSRSALQYNIKVISSLAGSKRIIFPVKANAYGHGLEEIVRMSASMVDCFMTATLEEAVKVRQFAPENDIFIDLPLINVDDIREAIERGFVINIATTYQLHLLEKLPHDILKGVRVQIEFDTGMNRTGFKYEDLKTVNTFFSRHPEIKVEGVFTHYATGLDYPESLRSQYKLFRKILSRIQFRYSFIHSENSAGLLAFNFSDMDYIRPGITLYGLRPSALYSISLRPVLSWKSQVVDVKSVKKGEGISYGLTFRAERDIKIATVPVGYGDGYPRSLSNKGYVIIRGKRVKIIGTICMNHLMVNVSEIEGVSVGDEVVILGEAGNDTITADEIANLAGTINYEITTRISPFIPRIIVET